MLGRASVISEHCVPLGGFPILGVLCLVSTPVSPSELNLGQQQGCESPLQRMEV